MITRLKTEVREGMYPLLADRIPSTYWENVKARAEQSFIETPIMSVFRLREMNIAKGEISEYDPEIDALSWRGYVTEEEYYRREQALENEVNPVISKEEFEKNYNTEYLGLEYHEGMRKLEAKLLVDRKTAEKKRQSIFRRSSDLSGIAKVSLFGVDLAAQFLDPLNIAMSFVPVVGEAKFAAMVGKVGKTWARLGTGFIEGAAGAIITEPLIYHSMKQSQADYDLNDSLLAVGFGGVFGSATHAGFGKIKDFFNISTKASDEMSRTAINQLGDGRDVKVDGIYKADKGLPLTEEDLKYNDKFYTDRDASKFAENEIEDLSNDFDIKAIQEDFNEQIESINQLKENGVIEEREFFELEQKMRNIEQDQSTYEKAVDAAIECLIRL